MNPYLEEIKARGITRLCHFTKSSNLPFILGNGKFERNGILASSYIRQSDYLEELDAKRLDGRLDYVCCSVQEPNNRYFNFRKRSESQKEALFNQWAVLYVDPQVIDDTTLFSPVNAATANGANIRGGINAFKNLFANPIQYLRRGTMQSEERSMFTQPNLPTNEQAEVLIKDHIPLERIIGVAFPESTFTVEKQRLEFCLDKINIEISKIKEI